MAFGFGGANKGWTAAAALFLALLVVPALALFVVPRFGKKPPAPQDRPGFSFKLGSNSDTEEANEPPSEKPAEETKPSLQGTVLDPDGAPIAHARVGCLDHPGELEFWTTSRDDGTFVLPLAAEGCRAAAFHDSFARSSDDHLYKDRPNKLRLGAPGSIEGVVVDERDAPIKDFKVAIESFVPADTDSPEPLPRVPEGVASQTGTFTLEKLPPGRYVLSASAAGRPPAHGEALDVVSGRAVRGVRLVLPGGERFVGRILDAETKQPVALASVALDAVSDSLGADMGRVTTDATGSFAIEAAPPGPFSIHVSHALYRDKIVSGLTTGFGAPPSVDIEITPRGDAGNAMELSGVGLRIGAMAGGKLRVLRVEGDSPAAEAGLEGQETITHIDGVDVSTLTVSECTQRLRGPSGSTVVVTVERGGRPADVTITRAELVTPY